MKTGEQKAKSLVFRLSYIWNTFLSTQKETSTVRTGDGDTLLLGRREMPSSSSEILNTAGPEQERAPPRR